MVMTEERRKIMKKKPIMRRIFNIIQIVLLAVSAIMILTCDYADFKQYQHITDTANGITFLVTDELRYAAKIPVNEGTITFSTLKAGDPLWATLSLGSIALCILTSLASIIRKSNDRDGLLHLFLPILPIFSFFSFAGMLELSSNIKDGYFNIFDYSDMFQTVLGILGVVFLLAFVKRSKLFNRKDALKVEIAGQQHVPASNADELKKYKELLDSGVISQEEFNAKKKQLLDL